jgi:alpha-beta hydrolase superfamily lysophospholipase
MDRWIDFSYSQQFYEKIQTKKRLVLIEGAGHLPMEAIGLSQLQLEMLKFMKEYCE